MSGSLLALLGAGKAGGSPTPPGYAGPGDLASGWLYWCGLRAFSAAAVGTNCVRLRRQSDNVEQDFATITGGGLDLAAITAFAGGSTLFVAKLYDQSGNGVDLIQDSAVSPAYTHFNSVALAGFGLVDSIATSANNLNTSSTVTIGASAFAFSYVGYHKSTPTHDQALLVGDAFSVPQIRMPTVTTIRIEKTSASSDIAISADAFHAVQAIFDGAASNICIDGADNIVDTGINTPSTEKLPLCVGFGGDYTFCGYLGEFGLIANNMASTRAAVAANQQAFWGF